MDKAGNVLVATLCVLGILAATKYLGLLTALVLVLSPGVAGGG